MKAELLKLLRCPQSGQELEVVDCVDRDGSIQSGWLATNDGRNRYPIRNFVPRFVPESNYADNFGMQWNRFSKTQLDSHSGHPISADRFWKATDWSPESLDGEWVLDVGCGAGRFAEIALQAGARVVALDYSSAVDACYANLRHHKKLHVVQGDVYSLPFLTKSFPFVYSLGVLQHTPAVEKAFKSLVPMVAWGGNLCVDFYQKSWKSMLLPKYWLRPITKHVQKKRLFTALETLVPVLLPFSRLLGSMPIVGSTLKRLVPVANYYDVLPLSSAQHQEWSLLDTFDWFSPEFDNPQTPQTVKRWMEIAGLTRIEVLKAGHLVGRGRIPKKNPH
jgi:2-polyprenyl-3-methyl-5-hydroxy-6-metoxy-1,4-benzoquinol methylase